MRNDVRSHYGFSRDFADAGYFETENSKEAVEELGYEIRAGKLITLSGIVGSGKTTTLRRVQEFLVRDKEILVSKVLAVEKSKITLTVLINAMFYDLATEKGFKIPTQPERRERVLRDLIKKRQQPIALFIDDAHDLHPKTLVGLKRVLEVVRDGGGAISIVLAGHPKLKNDLRRPTMEEIGLRAAILDLQGFSSGEKITYLKWLLRQCVSAKTESETLLSEEAAVKMAERLSTPLQFEQYLTRVFEEAYKIGQKRVGVDVIDAVLAKDLEDLEPRLVRHGYDAKMLTELLHAKPREIKALLRGQLPPGRARELQDQMLAVGIAL